MSIINVFNLTSDHQNLFVELLRHLMKQNIKIILINEKHIVSDELSLQHNIIVANSVVDQLKEAMHFYVTDNKPLGGGSNGDVYSIIAKFCLTPEGIIQQQALPQSLVVKFSKKVVCSEKYKKHCDDLYELEVSNTRAMSHLGFVMSAKERHNNQLVSAIIMKKQPGVELFDIINKILSLEYVSSQFQLQLTIALLSAYQAQLSSLLLIHGDIKPENIMVDLGMNYNELGASSHNKILADFVPPKIDCAFIDVERAKRYLTPYDIYIPLGSKKYLAPELNAARERGMAPPEIFEGEKIDIYSLGKVLSYLWRSHVVLASFLLQDESKVRYFFDRHYANFNDLLSFDLYVLILSYISEMSHIDYIDRPSISNALSFFNEMKSISDKQMNKRAELLLSIDRCASNEMSVFDVGAMPDLETQSPIVVTDIVTPAPVLAPKSPLVFSDAVNDTVVAEYASKKLFNS